MALDHAAVINASLETTKQGVLFGFRAQAEFAGHDYRLAGFRLGLQEQDESAQRAATNAQMAQLLADMELAQVGRSESDTSKLAQKSGPPLPSPAALLPACVSAEERMPSAAASAADERPSAEASIWSSAER